MKKVCIIGCFADTFDLLNGQTVKTKIVYKELEKSIGCDEVMKIDTYGGVKTLVKTPIIVLNALKSAQNIIILPAENGLRIIVPFLIGLNRVFKRNIYYDVIGGWLPEFVKKRKWLGIFLKKINSIFVETSSMKEQLKSQGYNNIEVIPNCKELDILDAKTIKYTGIKPYRLCTFSRVTKEKGIEDAVEAVKEANDIFGSVKVKLDLYGIVPEYYKERFAHLINQNKDFVEYKGVANYNQTVDVLKNYFALLFPTYFHGEGFAGCIIDAFFAGIPIIATDWLYNKDIVKDKKNGILVPIKNSHEIANAIVELYNNRDLVLEISKNNSNEAKKYTSKQVLKELFDYLDNGEKYE